MICRGTDTVVAKSLVQLFRHWAWNGTTAGSIHGIEFWSQTNLAPGRQYRWDVITTSTLTAVKIDLEPACSTAPPPAAPPRCCPPLQDFSIRFSIKYEWRWYLNVFPDLCDSVHRFSTLTPFHSCWFCPCTDWILPLYPVVNLHKVYWTNWTTLNLPVRVL